MIYTDSVALNPTQQKVIDLLGAPLAERPQFDLNLGEQLRSELESGLAPLVETTDADAFGGRALWLSKHDLSMVLGCEQRFLAEDKRPFSWTPQLARGTVSHKAVELAMNWADEPNPLDLVDKAITRLRESDLSIRDYLHSCSDVELAELRAEANEYVTKILEIFPPLKPSWRPTTEARLRAELLDKRVVLAGKVDMMLGRAETDDTTGKSVAGKVIVDFKTGGFSLQHRDDLRFYALLETLRIGVPPRKTATCYLDSGTLHPEDVTRDLLRSTIARVVDAAHRYVELTTAQREPITVTGPPCGWCPIQPDCAEGTAYLAARFGDDLYERF